MLCRTDCQKTVFINKKANAYEPICIKKLSSIPVFSKWLWPTIPSSLGIALRREQWAGASEKGWCEDGQAHRVEGGRERMHGGGRTCCCLVLPAEMCSLLCPCHSPAEELQASVVTSSASDGKERGPLLTESIWSRGKTRYVWGVVQTWGWNGAWDTLKTD